MLSVFRFLPAVQATCSSWCRNHQVLDDRTPSGVAMCGKTDCVGCDACDSCKKTTLAAAFAEDNQNLSMTFVTRAEVEVAPYNCSCPSTRTAAGVAFSGGILGAPFDVFTDVAFSVRLNNTDHDSTIEYFCGV